MQKKTMTIYIVIAGILLLVSIYFINQYRTKSITDFFNNDYTKISKLYMTNGNTGDIVPVNDKKIIKDICNYLGNLKFKKVYNKPSSGWSYAFTIYENDKEVFHATFNGDAFLRMNNSKYTIEKSTDVTVDALYNEAIKSADKK